MGAARSDPGESPGEAPQAEAVGGKGNGLVPRERGEWLEGEDEAGAGMAIGPSPLTSISFSPFH